MLSVQVMPLAKRLSSSDYTMTPDDDSAYDNAPWSNDNYNVMKESERHLCKLSLQEEIKASHPNITTTAQSTIHHHNVQKQSVSSNSSSQFSTRTTDSGVGSLKGISSLSTDEESMEGRLNSMMADFSDKSLDQLEKKMGGTKKTISVRRRAPQNKLQTKKTKGGAIKAISK